MILPRPYRLLAALAAIALVPAVTAHAINVNLSGSDTLGNTSFNAATNWSNAAPPSAANDYFTGDFILRTPPDANSYTFGGNSLTVNNTNGYPQGLFYKGTGNTGIITINNLILNGGFVSHGNGVGDLLQLAGNINVTAASTIFAKQGSIDIAAPISGTGGLTIPVTDAAGETANRFVTLLGANSYTGNISVLGKLRLGNSGSMKFNVGASGVNNNVTGAGIAQYNGAFNFDFTIAGTTLGNSWAITSVATQTFGDTFNVPGFLEYATGSWVKGNYQFSEATGVLSVAPAPDLLTLRVNTTNGLTSIVNATTGATVNMNYYEVRSAGGFLGTGSWTSLDGYVPASSTTWEKAGGSNANLISETNLLGIKALAPTNNTSLGNAYTGTLPANQDLQFYYRTSAQSGTLFRGFVEYVTATVLSGDFNGNGKVDAADYTIWRNNLGQPEGNLLNGNGHCGTIDQTDYALWMTNFGSGGGGSVAGQSRSVPEPATFGLMIFVACCGLAARRSQQPC